MKPRKPLKPNCDYKKKYRRLKRQIQELVFENAAIHDEITLADQQYLQAKGERKLLLNRLFHHLPMTEAQVLQSTQALNALKSNFPGRIPQTILSPVLPGQELSSVPMLQLNHRSNEATNSLSPALLTVKPGTRPQETPSQYLPVDQVLKMPMPSVMSYYIGETSEDSQQRKRKKPGTAARKRVLPIPLDYLRVPILPITLGTLSVYDLGEVVSERASFHSERYIWPVGYRSTRSYPSMNDPQARMLYYCSIQVSPTSFDPLFEIIPEDEPDNPITAPTATACHCKILKRLNTARGRDATNTGSGPEFFGFSHSTIQYLIQSMRGSEHCDKYQAISFELPSSDKESLDKCQLTCENLPRLDLLNRGALVFPEMWARYQGILNT